MTPEFIHLHLHSEYSLVDSTIRIKALVEACVEAGMPAIAVTDESNLFALVKFYKAATAAGLKPVIGCDLRVAGNDDEAQARRLTLLCQNREGYLNLSRLISRAWLEGQRGGHALIQAGWLQSAHQGLVAILGRESEAARLALSGSVDSCDQHLRQMDTLFDRRLYLEISRCGNEHEENWNQAALGLAERMQLPLLASNDVRFLRREDFEAHEARVCIRQGRTLADERRAREYSPEQYLKTPAQMAELFSDLPEALENSVELAKRCNLALEFETYHLPEFPVPEGHDLASFIHERAEAGLRERLQMHAPAAGFSEEDYRQRLDRELEVILSMGFPGYFLIVADFINWAKQQDIPVGPGRGSGAGSLVAYALRITDLDPMPLDLLFERFLNPERVSMPDFDVDFCMERRDEVIEYVAEKYGRDHVSQIITYGTMAAKAVVRDTGRVLGMGYGYVDSIAKLIPMTLGIRLDDALGRSARSRKDPNLASSDLIRRYQEEDDVRELIDLACRLEDLTRNAGKHAGGVVIAPEPLTHFAPLYCEPGGAGVVTQFDKDDVEAVGLVKFDFLGLRTLTIIDWAVKAINAGRGSEGESALDIAQLPLDDARTYAMFARGDTVAVFQFESRGMRELLKRAQPDTFEDIIALNALFRPGPMDLIPSFIERKHSRETVEYPDPRVEAILKETYGIMVYQEQVMQMAQIVGGYTLGGADLLRRAMGKKKPAEMAKHRELFREGAAKNGLSAHKADAIFDLMEKFAGYGFNKSHAAAYALVSYQTAWLKAHYPAEFMAATLSADMDNTDKVVNLLDEAKAIGIQVLPPDVNASGYMFSALDKTRVQYGLGAIKGVGRAACEAIAATREREGDYHDLLDFCLRVEPGRINKRLLEALIQSGAMDALARNRATLMAQLPEVVRAAEQQLRDRSAGQHDIFGDASTGAVPEPSLPKVEEWPHERKLAGERDTLGHYLSGHPTDGRRELLEQLATCALGDIEKRYKPPANGENRRGRVAETPWIVAGQVIAIRRRGDAMAFVQIEDWSGRVEVSLFREVFTEASPLLTRDALLVVEGGLAPDEFSGGFQLRARRVRTLEDVCEQQARWLRLRLDGIDENFPVLLRKTLDAFRGGHTRLRLEQFRNDCARADFELPEDWCVRACPQLLGELRKLPGVEQATLALARPGLEA